MADVGELCARLEASFAERSFADALELSERILAEEPQSEVGLRCLCACLVQLARPDEALALLDEHAEALREDGVLLRAFCLYQKADTPAALALIEPELAAGASRGVDGPSTRRRLGLLHLQAQLLYKRGDYAEAAEAYGSVLSEDPSAGADEEVLTNATAAYLMAGRPDEALRLTPVAARAAAGGGAGGCSLYELAYNCACARIAQGEYAAADALLDEALALSTHALAAEDVADDDEVAAEQAAIRAQKAYVAQRSGREGAAQEAYLGVLRVKGHEAIDTSVAAVAANNLVALRRERDLFDSAKRCKAALSGAVAAKLLPAQRLAFMANQVLLTWHMGKPSLCREQLDAMDSAFPASDVPALLRLGLLLRPKPSAKEAAGPEAEALVRRWAAERPELAARPMLALAQVQARAPPPPAPKGSPPAEPLRRAVDTLAATPGLRLRPRLVATVALLLESLGETAEAAAFLDQTLELLAADEPRGADSGLPRAHAAILRGAGAFFERHGLWRQSAAVQTRLLQANPRDLAARARLVVAASHFDAALAAQHDEQLPDVAAGADGGEDEGGGEEEGGEMDGESAEKAALEASGSSGGPARGYQPAAAAAPIAAAVPAVAAAAGGKRPHDKGAGGTADPSTGPSKRSKCARAAPARPRAAPAETRALHARALRRLPCAGSASRGCQKDSTRQTRARRPTPSAGCQRGSAPPTAGPRHAQPRAADAPARRAAVGARALTRPLRAPPRARRASRACAARQEERGADARAAGRGWRRRRGRLGARLQRQGAERRRRRPLVRAATTAAAGRGRAQPGQEEGGRQKGQRGLVTAWTAAAWRRRLPPVPSH